MPAQAGTLQQGEQQQQPGEQQQGEQQQQPGEQQPGEQQQHAQAQQQQAQAQAQAHEPDLDALFEQPQQPELFDVLGMSSRLVSVNSTGSRGETLPEGLAAVQHEFEQYVCGLVAQL